MKQVSISNKYNIKTNRNNQYSNSCTLPITDSISNNNIITIFNKINNKYSVLKPKPFSKINSNYPSLSYFFSTFKQPSQ